MLIKRNFRITILSIDERITTCFETQKVAIDTIIMMKKIDEGFLAGVLEEKINGKWTVTWSLK